MKRPTTVVSRMFNPYSNTSVWKNKDFTEGAIVTGILILVLVISNIITIMIIKYNNPNYNYTTGCIGNYTPDTSIWDDYCYNINGIETGERFMCGNPIYVRDFTKCTILGAVALFMIAAVVIIITVITIIIMYGLCKLSTFTINVFVSSYTESTKSS